MSWLEADGLDGLLIRRIPPPPMLLDDDDDELTDDLEESSAAEEHPLPLSSAVRAVVFVGRPEALSSPPAPPPVAVPLAPPLSSPEPSPLVPAPPAPAPVAASIPHAPGHGAARWWLAGVGGALAAAGLLLWGGGHISGRGMDAASPENATTAALLMRSEAAVAVAVELPSVAAPAPVAVPAPEAQTQQAPTVLAETLSEPADWTVRFGFNQVELAPGLEVPAALLRCERLQVVGSACALGPAEANQKIAAGRAVSVGHLLESAGVAADRIQLHTQLFADRQQSRRRRTEVRCLSAVGDQPSGEQERR